MSTQTKAAKPAAAPQTPQKPATQTNSVVKATPSAVTSPIDWSASGTTGFENVQATDLGIPFLVILQKGSPQIDPSHRDYGNKKLEGASTGCIIDTVANRVLHRPGGPPLIVHPVAWDKYYVEWAPREKNGGFVRAHKEETILATCRRNEKNQDVLPNGNLIVTTAYFHVIVRSDDGDRQYTIGLSSTQLKKSRQWLNLATGLKVTLPDGRKITPPLYSHGYELTTEAENNAKGSWMGWKVRVGEMVVDLGFAEELAELSKKCANLVPASAPDDGSSEEPPM